MTMPTSARPRSRGPLTRTLAMLGLSAALAAALCACTQPDEVREATVTGTPGPTFVGEPYLNGTVKSYGRFINNRPKLVSGYGMVVDLAGTGSSEVPSFLRDWLITEMGRNNIGSAEFDTAAFTPQRVMADSGSAVVAVEGFIPPGSTVGTRFDILVSMVDQTSTSLAGGRLFWPTTLAQAGLDKRLLFTRPQATAIGPVYVNPIRPADDADNEFLRQAVIIRGGIVTEPNPIEYILNQPSYLRARQIENRINERFPAGPEDKIRTAVAKSDVLIQLNIPERFSGDPDLLLDLIAHLYLDPSRDFVPRQAEYLAQRLLEDPADRAPAVTTAWKAMGRNTIPVLRNYYDHRLLPVRYAALEAAAWLQDDQAVAPLVQLSRRGETEDRLRAAMSLAAISRSPEARDAVRAMLDDKEMDIRLGAYEALALAGDATIERTEVGQGANFKFFIDRVPSERPLIYATQQQNPALVVFGDELGFRRNIFGQIGDGLTIQTVSTESMRGALVGLYEGDSAFLPIHRSGRVGIVEPAAAGAAGIEAEPYWEIEIGDNRGETFTLRVRGEQLIEQVETDILAQPGRTVAAAAPRKIALARIVHLPGTDAQGNRIEGVAELVQIREPDAALPLMVSYQAAGGAEPKTYRIQPTVATLAFTLGYKRSPHLAQVGPDLPFSSVVHALYRLCETQQIPAPFQVNYNQLAEAVSQAQQQGGSTDRPDFNEEDLITETTDDTSAAPLDFNQLPAPDAEPSDRDDFGDAPAE